MKRSGSKRLRRNRRFTDSTHRNVQVNNTEDVTEIAPLESAAEKRPMGHKKAKEALRRGGGEACMWRLWIKCGLRMRLLTWRKRRRKRRGTWLHLSYRNSSWH